MIFTIITTISIFIFYFISFDFKYLLYDLLVALDFQNLPTFAINLISLIILSAIGSGFLRYHKHIITHDLTNVKIYDSQYEFVNDNKKKFTMLGIGYLFSSLALALISFIIYFNYFNLTLEELKIYAEEDTGFGYFLNFYGTLIVVVLIASIQIIRAIRHLFLFISMTKGIYALNENYCNVCFAGGNSILMHAKSTSISDTVLDSMDKYGYVDTDVSYDSYAEKININTSPKTVYFKQETTTTVNKKYTVCRCCGDTKVDTNVDKTTKKYVMDGKRWRER